MERRIVLMDGATGTRLWELAERAGKARAPVWTYNLTCPELVRRVADEYIAAGTKLLLPTMCVRFMNAGMVIVACVHRVLALLLPPFHKRQLTSVRRNTRFTRTNARSLQPV